MNGHDQAAQHRFGQPARRSVTQDAAALAYRAFTGNNQDTTPTGMLAIFEEARECVMGGRLGQAVKINATVNDQLTTPQPFIGTTIETGTLAKFQRRQTGRRRDRRQHGLRRRQWGQRGRYRGRFGNNSRHRPGRRAQRHSIAHGLTPECQFFGSWRALLGWIRHGVTPHDRGQGSRLRP